MELIFILTYDCNFRCHYCDIDKRKQDMSAEVIAASLEYIKTIPLPIDRVKFFGGEPLLSKESLSTIVKNFPLQPLPRFMVTTNTTLVDGEFMAFAQEHDILVTFSIDGDSQTNQENRIGGKSPLLLEQIVYNTERYAPLVRVNQVITSSNANRFYQNFLFLYSLGVRRFNFLPDYYHEWTKQGLEDLKRGFDQILESYRLGNDFELVNLENFSETPFFNLGIVIDTDGQIYGTNLILSGVFEKYKKDLVLGNVYDGCAPLFYEKEFQREYIQKIHACIQIEYSPQVLRSVTYTDLILNYFVREYQAYRTQYRQGMQ